MNALITIGNRVDGCFIFACWISAILIPLNAIGAAWYAPVAASLLDMAGTAGLHSPAGLGQFQGIMARRLPRGPLEGATEAQAIAVAADNTLSAITTDFAMSAL